MEAAALGLLAEAELEIEGRLLDASNATFLCRPAGSAADAGAGAAPDAIRFVYKPVRGERPLDDFPHGTLANRERAAFLLSEATGWGIVPPTILREGPFGRGMLQLWVQPDPQADVVAMVLAPDSRLRRVAVFDIIANNADRKGSHLLPLSDGHVHAVDHGVCFASQPKLRTVLWAWRDQPLEPDEIEALTRVAEALEGSLGAELGELLEPAEVRATIRRTERLLKSGRLPLPDPSRPALPWPPF